MKLDLTDEELTRLQALADAADDAIMRGVRKGDRVRVMALRVFEAGLDALEPADATTFTTRD
jgi:hypothetical protein